MAAPASVASIARALHQGDTGPDVLAVKRALIKWDKGKPDGVSLSNTFGPRAVALLEQFQQRDHLTADGIYGPLTAERLLPFFDKYGLSLIAQERAALTPRNLFLSIADLTVAHTSLFGYTENGGEAPGERDWFRVAPIDLTGGNWGQVVVEHGKLTSDCSGHYYGCAWHAGIRIANPDGATGALLALSRISLAQALPGDGVIWVGSEYPGGRHITILRARVGPDWRTINNGGPSGTGPIYSTLSAQNGFQVAGGAPTQIVVRLPA